MYGEDLSQISTKVHCIGHSLGAQACGYVGSYLQSTSHKIARITGLDPAEPYFGYAPAIVALDKTDAIYVDVIHTDDLHFRENAIKLMPEGMGVEEPVGHVDFYPNNGTAQPGCDQSMMSTIFGMDGLMDGARNFVACNHMRSIELFLQSLQLSAHGEQICKFTGYECSYNALIDGSCMDCGEECVSMGWDSIQGHNGEVKEYRLMTAGSDLKHEYCTHSSQVEIRLGYQTDKTKGRIYMALYGNEDSTTLVQVTEKGTIDSNDVYDRVLNFDQDVGEIETVKLIWMSDEINIISTPRITVDYITMFYGDEQQGYRFCYNGKMVSDVRYTFTKC